MLNRLVQARNHGPQLELHEALQACLAAMLRIDEKVREERETGWLVENGMPSDIKYRFMDDDGPQWTIDPLKAIRFARRADAEMFAAGDDDAWRIVEHMFVSPAAASDGEQRSQCAVCGNTGRLTIYDSPQYIGQLCSPIGDEPCPSCNGERE